MSLLDAIFISCRVPWDPVEEERAAEDEVADYLAFLLTSVAG